METQIQYTDKFCYACGKGLIRSAAVCPGCGTPAVASIDNPRSANIYSSPQSQPSLQEPKSKTAAVILAVFLGFWAFLYTYQVNASRFWLHFAAHLFAIFTWVFLRAEGWPGALTILISWLTTIVRVGTSSEALYRQYPAIKR